MRSATSLLAFVALAGNTGCTHTMTVKSEDPSASIIIDGTVVGVAGTEGASVEVRRSPLPVPYEVHGADGAVALGTLERTDMVWWLVALGGAGALCCAPSLATGGFLLANPAILGSPVAFLVSNDVGTLTRSCSNPSWLSIPALVLCGSAGAAPLGVAFFAEEPPATVTLPAPTAAGRAATAASAMRF